MHVRFAMTLGTFALLALATTAHAASPPDGPKGWHTKHAFQIDKAADNSRPAVLLIHGHSGANLAGKWHIFNAGNGFGGKLYVRVKSSEDLRLYTDKNPGKPDRSLAYGGVLGTGWNQFRLIAGGDQNTLYGVKPDGTLVCYRAPDTPKGKWSSRVIGSGWNQFEQVFGGQGGILYGVAKDGRLVRYEHRGFKTCQKSWGKTLTMARRDMNSLRFFGGAEGVLYGIKR